MNVRRPSELEIVLEQLKRNLGGKFKGAFFIPFVFLLFIFAMTSYYTVGPDEEAVIIRLGKYLGTYSPGLHFKLPFGIDRLTKVKTTRVHQLEFGFRTEGYQGGRTSYDSSQYKDESSMLTGDLNVADVEWVVHYKISDPYKYLFQTKTPLKNIRDVAESIMRRVVGDQFVTQVLTTGRMGIAIEAKSLMQEVLDKYDMGINIVTVKLQDVNPPDLVRPSFNEVNAAKQEQEKLINQAEEAYNKVIPEARGKANKLVSEAEGHAMAVVNRAEGDAQKFNAVLREYKKAPSITRKRIYLETMEEVFAQIENFTIVDPEIKGLLPIYGESLGTNTK